MQQSLVHVIFTPDGLPGWFGLEPVVGSEPLDLEELRPLVAGNAGENALAASWQGILITHCRVGGVWVLRDAVAVADPVEIAQEGPSAEPGPSASTFGVDAAE